MRRLRVLIAVAGVVAVAACGNNGDDDDTTAVPEDTSGSENSEEEGASLIDTHWTLDKLTVNNQSTKAPTETEAFLTIDGAEIGGNTGCNTFGGDVEVSEESDMITVGPMIATKRACSGALGDVDSAMTKVLQGEVKVEIAGDKLTLTNADGAQLVLHANDEAAEDDAGTGDGED